MSNTDTEVTAYMCRIAFECEIDGTACKVYPTLDDLREAHPCADNCGIVEVRVSLVRVVVEGDVS